MNRLATVSSCCKGLGLTLAIVLSGARSDAVQPSEANRLVGVDMLVLDPFRKIATPKSRGNLTPDQRHSASIAVGLAFRFDDEEYPF